MNIVIIVIVRLSEQNLYSSQSFTAPVLVAMLPYNYKCPSILPSETFGGGGLIFSDSIQDKFLKF